MYWPVYWATAFKRPMSFTPGVHRPTPSREEKWAEELGLENELEDCPSSEDELEEIPPTPGCSLIEYQSLTKELEHRNIERDELLHKSRDLTEKARQYKSRLHQEGKNRKQQVRMLNKLHETKLEEKAVLVRSLERVIGELEAGHYGSTGTPDGQRLSSKIHSFVVQVERLETEKGDLLGHLMTSQTKTENTTSEMNEMKERLKESQKTVRDLDAEIASLNGTKTNGRTDTEKQLKKMELENSRLQGEIDEMSKSTHHVKLEMSRVKKLEEEKEKLLNRVLNLETDVAIKSKLLSEGGGGSREELNKLKSENARLVKDVRDERLKVTDLESREPEVVTKVERVTVEVESESTKRALELASNENKKHSREIRTYQKMYNDSNQQLTTAHIKITERERKLKEYEQQMGAVQSQFKTEISLLEENQKKKLILRERQAEAKMQSIASNYTNVQREASRVGPAFANLLKKYKDLKRVVSDFPAQMKQCSSQTTREICKAIGSISDHNKELVRKYKKEMALRKKYHNELVELKGNIRVFCRVRPKIKEDGAGRMAESVVAYDPDDDAIVNIRNKGGRMQSMEVDRVFQETSTQKEVFDEVRALVTSCVDGYNVCIFAYGQTGSGKTYTMEGLSTDPGINQRALRELFRETSERAPDWKYEIDVSATEIYNEVLRDLLSDDPTVKLDVKMSPDGGLCVPGLTSVRVHTVDDVNRTFTIGHENRATASTNLNEHSSRSHALLCVTLTGVNTTTGVRTIGKLNLVDLAGSERVSKSGAEGDRLREAQNINKSLSSLGDVIAALRCKQNHVPYRNSKLTYLLQDSLGGDSKTLMIVQVAPVEKNVSETLASLNFAQRVRTVELGMATKRLEGAEGAAMPMKHSTSVPALRKK